jgi:UDP-N-acetylglucosamine 1-carboxyvinyltransferase
MLAALAASGETTVTQLQHVDRGYADLTENLKAIGADIRRE